AQRRDGALESLANLRREAPAQPARGHVQARAPRHAAVRHAPLRHHFVEQRAVGDAERQRTGVVAGPRQRQRAVERNRSVRRLVAGDRAEGGGNAHRAAGVAADRRETDAGGHRNAGSAGGAARLTRRIEGIADVSGPFVLAGAAEGDLVHVRLREHERTGGAQPCDQRRLVAAQRRQRRARSGAPRHATHRVEVLDRNGDAVQRTAQPPAARLLVEAARFLERRRPVDPRDRVQVRMALGVVPRLLEQRLRAAGTRRDGSGDGRDRFVRRRRRVGEIASCGWHGRLLSCSTEIRFASVPAPGSQRAAHERREPVDRYHAPMRPAWALALMLACVAPLCAQTQQATRHAPETSSVSSGRSTPEASTGWQLRPPVFAERLLAVTANPHATRAAVAILEAGGNAVDAAIAAQMVLVLVEPQSSGIGGGAFLLLYEARTGRVLAFDGRETAPARAAPELFLRADGTPMGFFEAAIGGRAVGVPGAVRMLERVHAKHGALAWPKLFEPAIRLA